MPDSYPVLAVLTIDANIAGQIFAVAIGQLVPM
jgi:hypothetical protein